jgi:hypothetical protein
MYGNILRGDGVPLVAKGPLAERAKGGENRQALLGEI